MKVLIAIVSYSYAGAMRRYVPLFWSARVNLIAGEFSVAAYKSILSTCIGLVNILLANAERRTLYIAQYFSWRAKI